MLLESLCNAATDALGIDIRKPDMEMAYWSAMVCFAVLIMARSLLTRVLAKDFPKFSEDKRWEFCNRVLSLCVCVTMSILAFLYWSNNTAVEYEMAITPFQFQCISIMVGYILYDIVVCIFVESELTLLFFIHHLSGLLSHMLVLTRMDGLGAFYSMAVYIAEGSTPFYHIAWMLNELRCLPGADGAAWSQGLPDAVFKFCSLMLMLCFFAFRVLLSPYIVYHAATIGMPEWTAHHSYEYGVVHTVILAIFSGINMYWFYCLIRAAVDSFAGPKEKEA